MNTSLLLKSSTLWGVLAFSGVASTGILLFSPGGIGSLHKRQAELLDQQRQLLKMRRANLELGEEVKRLAARDPELYEALARQQGLARPGETIYTFRERGAPALMLTIASASGNAFAYAWDALPPGDGPAWARALCPGRKLDGLFLLARPVPGRPWAMEHWDADGAATFCSNGTRAALALPGAPPGAEVAVVSSGEQVRLRREGAGVAILMPSGPGTGFRPFPAPLEGPHAFGWVGNPQLVLERPGVESLDLGRLAAPLRRHPALPGGTNVNVIEMLGPGEARIRSWERGVEGETLCCGTGCAVAGAWLARRTGIRTWRLLPRGGEVTVTARLKGEGWRELWLSGPVAVMEAFAADPSLLS